MGSRLFFIALLILTSPSWADVNDLNGLDIGLNYPGIGLRYTRSSYSVETRFQMLSGDGSNEETSIIGLRVSKLHRLRQKYFWYFGLEGAHLHYKYTPSNISSDGWLTGVYLGLEALLGHHLSWSIDMGPYYGRISEQSSGTANVVDIALNSSLYFHFGRGRK